jgi:hypothetical protein
MAINELIARGSNPIQFESPVNRLAKMLQIQGAQQNIARGEMEQDQYRQGVERKNKLVQLMSGLPADATDDQRSAALKGGGYFDEADKLDKNALKRREIGSKASAEDIATARKKLDIAGSAFNQVRQSPTLENANAVLDYLGANGVYTPELVAQYKAQVAANPADIGRLADIAFRSAIDAKDQLAKNTSENLGGNMAYNSTDPLTGKVTQTGLVPITQSADNAATQATSIANNKATVGASYANAAATREIANATRDAAKIQTGFTNEQGLRKEFEGLKEVTNYKQAYPAYAAVKDAVGRNTPQSDINLVYAIAKLYDPTSVVREGEYATVANSPNIPERIKGYAQYLAGGGRLSPETKAQILAEAQGRIGTYEAEAKKAKTSYENIARKRGMDPASVFADMGDMVEGGAKPPPPNAISVPDDIRALLTKHSGKK